MLDVPGTNRPPGSTRSHRAEVPLLDHLARHPFNCILRCCGGCFQPSIYHVAVDSSIMRQTVYKEFGVRALMPRGQWRGFKGPELCPPFLNQEKRSWEKAQAHSGSSRMLDCHG